MSEKNFAIVPFEKALELEEQGNIDEAIYSYRYLAEQDEILAVQKMAILSWEGIGIEKDLKETIKWLRRGVRLKDKFCIFNLARCYRDGYGIEQSEERAIELFHRCATLNDSDSELILAKYYLEQKNDFRQFVFWLKKSLQQKNEYAFVYWQMKCAELQSYLNNLIEVSELEKQMKTAEELRRRQKDLEWRLRNSWWEVIEIFMEKKLDNKVHWYRGK